MDFIPVFIAHLPEYLIIYSQIKYAHSFLFTPGYTNESLKIDWRMNCILPPNGDRFKLEIPGILSNPVNWKDQVFS